MLKTALDGARVSGRNIPRRRAISFSSSSDRLNCGFGSRKQEREKEKALAALGVDPDDQRGKENIEWSDCGFAEHLARSDC